MKKTTTKKATKKPNPSLKLFHIGDKFYTQSGTMMSSIYQQKTKERCDWGKVQLALSAGTKVSIRPATEAELKWAEQELKKANANRNTYPVVR